MKVFINPVVAALFPEHGCFGGRGVHKTCGKGRGGKLETTLPKSFCPVELKPEMDDAWDQLVKQHITIEEKSNSTNST
jgi:hypothetical protein